LVAEHPTTFPDAALRMILAVVTDDISRAPSSEEATETTSSLVAMSPTDRIESAVRDIRSSVIEDLLDLIGRESPSFFERLVLDLLLAMGYGTSRREIQSVGRSGDGGIDGIISLDRLGLQKVYVQAKRWQGSVGSPTVRDFIGALSTHHGADKGVLFTLSSFTQDAYATAASMRSGTIVLIDGRRLAELMVDHQIGVTHQVVQVPKIDSDYFDGPLT
jgi:restriction system protein